MAKTNSGLVEYVKAKIGCYYWFGCFGQMASAKLYEQKKAQYAKYYKANDYAKQIADPKQVFDCAGIIKAYYWTKDVSDVKPKYDAKTDYGATAFYQHCTKKGTIKTFDGVAGRLLFKGTPSKMSHVGVYLGDNKIGEAKGHKWGVIISELDGTWTHWGQSNLFEDDTSNPQPIPDPTPAPQPQPAPAPSTQKYRVKTKTGVPLRLRAKPTTASSVLALIPNGTIIEVSETQNGWAKTTYKGKSGWCSLSYLVKV